MIVIRDMCVNATAFQRVMIIVMAGMIVTTGMTATTRHPRAELIIGGGKLWRME